MNSYNAPYDNQANQIREVTTTFLYDDYAVAPATLLSEQALFVTSTKTVEYQNFQLPSQLDRLLVVTHIYATHNFQFTVGDASQNLWEQQRFETHSYLNYSIQDKKYPSIPLWSILTHTLGLEGTSLTKTPKLNQMFQLKDPIQIPPAGTASFAFTPAQGLTTLAAGVTNPTLPGRGFTTNRAYSMTLFLYGYLDRPAA